MDIDVCCFVELSIRKYRHTYISIGYRHKNRIARWSDSFMANFLKCYSKLFIEMMTPFYRPVKSKKKGFQFFQRVAVVWRRDAPHELRHLNPGSPVGGTARGVYACAWVVSIDSLVSLVSHSLLCVWLEMWSLSSAQATRCPSFPGLVDPAFFHKMLLVVFFHGHRKVASVLANSCCYWSFL